MAFHFAQGFPGYLAAEASKSNGNRLCAVIASRHADPATLNSLFVAAAHRNQAIGAALCEDMERQMKATGAARFALYGLAGKGAGRHFCERRGWRSSHRMERSRTVRGGTVAISVRVMVKDAP